MKVELSEQDKNRVKRLQSSSPYAMYQRHKHELQFEVGDVLIKEVDRSWNGRNQKWEVEKASSVSLQPAKYVYMLRDDNGIGYVKKMKADGNGFVGNIMCLLDMNLDKVKFKVDISYQDALITAQDENFDPAKAFKEEKELRAKIREANLKKMIRTTSFEKLVSKLKAYKGKTIWMAHDATGDFFEEVIVGDIVKEKDYDDVVRDVLLLHHTDEQKRTEKIKLDHIWSKKFFTERPQSCEDFI
jgi:hypothetical protein